MTIIIISHVPDSACVGSEEVDECCPCREVSGAEGGKTILLEEAWFWLLAGGASI